MARRISSMEILMKLTKEVEYYLGDTKLGNERETAKWIAENCSDDQKHPVEVYQKGLNRMPIPERE